MGGFSAQVQPSQSSAPAGKGAGMSSMQMGMNPIEQSFPQKLENNMMQPDAVDPTQGLTGGRITMPGQGGQPQLGMPNAYSNTMQPWDNQPNQSSGIGYQPFKMTGKGA